MKKIIASAALIFVLLAGTVSGSSINGEYKGNPIVKVKSNGKALETGEVPAMIHDGNTLVPISLLRQLGATVTWEPETYSVNVTLPQSQSQANSFEDARLFVESAERNLRNNNIPIISYNVSIEEDGALIRASYESSPSVDNMTQMRHLAFILSMASIYKNHPLGGSIVELKSGNQVLGTISASYDNAVLFSNNKLTLEQFVGTWKITNFRAEINSLNQSQSSNSTNSSNDASCRQISKMYDESYEETKDDLKRRGLVPDSVEYDKRYLPLHEKNKEQALLRAGCSDTLSPDQAKSKAVCNDINSKYDGMIREKEEELGARGIARSSILTDYINSVNAERSQQLINNGCS